MNGGDGRQLDVNVDGGDNKDNVVGSLLQNFAYESIQEFQVLQHRWTAESGRAVGGVVNVITQVGHATRCGLGLLTFRNEALIAKDFFQDARRGRSRRSSAGSTADRSADRSSGTSCSSSARSSVSTSRADNADPRQTAIFNSSPPIPGSSAGATHPDAVRRHAVDDQGRSAADDRQSLSIGSRLPEDSSSPNDQVANPALTDLSGGSTNDNTSTTSWPTTP